MDGKQLSRGFVRSKSHCGTEQEGTREGKKKHREIFFRDEDITNPNRQEALGFPINISEWRVVLSHQTSTREERTPEVRKETVLQGSNISSHIASLRFLISQTTNSLSDSPLLVEFPPRDVLADFNLC